MNNYRVGETVVFVDTGIHYKVVFERQTNVYDRQGNNQILVLEDDRGHMLTCRTPCVRRLTPLVDSDNIVDVEWEFVED